MARFVLLALFFSAVTGLAQSPSPTPSRSPAASPSPSASATAPSPSPKASAAASASASASPSAAASASPSPKAPGALNEKELIDSLTQSDLDQAVSLLKKNFTQPDAINETQLSRATIEGLIMRLGPGVMLLPDKNAAPPEIAADFYSDILQKHVDYLRLGSLTAANLQALDKKLGEIGGDKNIEGVVVDLRASAGNDFEVAAQFANRFVAKGKTLFTLKKQGKDKAFTSERDPFFRGLLLVLADSETAGGAEAIASALRNYDKALVIGQTTAGRAVEYSDLPLPSGKILRVAVAEVIGPDGKSLYPGGVKPDLPVEMSLVDKRQIFASSAGKGMAPFVSENERPHLNEAALMAGTNPELETSDQRRRVGQQPAGPHDAMLQRALDLITSLEIFQKK